MALFYPHDPIIYAAFHQWKIPNSWLGIVMENPKLKWMTYPLVICCWRRASRPGCESSFSGFLSWLGWDGVGWVEAC